MLARLKHKTQLFVHSLQDMSLDEMKDEAANRGQRLVDSTKGLFRFLTGEEIATPSQPVEVREQKEEKEEKGWMSSVTGMFSGIKGGSKSSSPSGDTWNGTTFAEGEVHADLVMVCVLGMLPFECH